MTIDKMKLVVKIKALYRGICSGGKAFYAFRLRNGAVGQRGKICVYGKDTPAP